MKKYTLQNKITKTFMGLFTCILILITIVMAVVSGRVYWNKSYQLCEQLVDLNLKLLNNHILEIQKAQENIAKNSLVREMVEFCGQQEERDYGGELQYRRKLDEVFYMFANRDDVGSAYIIDREGNYLYFYKESLKIGYNMLGQRWYRELIDSVYMDTCFVSGVHDQSYLVNDKGGQCVSMVMPIQIKDNYTFSADAFLVCDVTIDVILNSSGHKNNMRFAILDNHGNIYGQEALPLSEEESLKIINAAEKEDKYVETLKRSFLESFLIVSMKSQVFGWKVIGVKELQEISYLMITLALLLGCSIIFAVLAVLFLSRKVAKNILMPMNGLIDECNQVAAGDYHITFEEKKIEEVSFLSDTIEEMVRNIVQLSQKVVEEEKALSDEKMRVLQHQINPHFLNNVLQTIKALAVAGETEKVSRISTLLGHILAYSVYEPYENVELATEMEYVKNYIELQNIRYDNRIFYSIDCEEEVKAVQIPKLTLQPLVENAIEHGYKGSNKISINISAEVDSDMVCIIINDNGQGIPEPEFEELKQRLADGKAYSRKRSIGIVNVNERLQKIFGLEYGIQIHSREHGGTTVIIRIPNRKDGR